MNEKQQNDSQVIAATFGQLRQFCRDVATLLETAEHIFRERDWRSAQGDKTCVWNGSDSLEQPDGWLPRQFFRSYKHPSRSDILGYVAVIAELPTGRDDGNTLFTAGALWNKDANGWVNPSTRFLARAYQWHLARIDRRDDGQLTLHEPIQWEKSRMPAKWTTVTEKIVKAMTLAIPIHQLTDVQSLRDLIGAVVSRSADPGIALSGLSRSPDADVVVHSTVQLGDVPLG